MNHKELEIWKESMLLAEQIYKISNDFPSTETFGMTSQIRRAAVSIPSNIAEGAGRKSDKEFLDYLNIGLGSLAELETHYLLSVRLKFIEETKDILNQINTVKRLLLGTRNYIIRKSKEPSHVSLLTSHHFLRCISKKTSTKSMGLKTWNCWPPKW